MPFVLVASLCFSHFALASPDSEALVRRGLMAFEGQRYDDAIHFFREAVRADPRDLNAVFLHGATLNRLGNYRDAYVLISGFEARGAKHPDLDFEAGWALMGLGRDRECVERLERFERNSPGRGQASEFLGRCYLRLGDHARAEAKLHEAASRDPRLKPSVDLSLARLEQARNRPDAARDSLRAAAHANAPTGRALRDVLGVPEPVFQPEKPLSISGALSIGHNDNVIGLGSTIPLPSDITRKSAHFLRAQVAAAYQRVLTASTTGALGYAGLFDRYRDLGVANLNDHFFYGDLFSVFGRVGGSLRLSHERTDLNNDDFRDQSALRLGASYRFIPNSVSEIALQHSSANYHMPTIAQFDRDGHANALSLAHRFRVPRSGWGGSVTAVHTRNYARGSDFRFDSLGAEGALRYEFANRMSSAVGLGFTAYDYDAPNSLSPSGAKRKDDQVLVNAQIGGPLRGRLSWVVQAQHLRNDSNIPFFDFSQNVVSAGISANF